MLMIENQEARFLYVIGYFDGKENIFFQDNEIGFIIKNKREDNLRGWTDLMTLSGYKLYPDKALCELSDNEWDNYINVLSEQDAWKLLINYIKNENVSLDELYKQYV